MIKPNIQVKKGKKMKKVLVVEDSIVINKIIQIILEKEDIEVIHTSDGSLVVDMVKNEGVDLVLLDLMMPIMSGEEVFKSLKSDPDTKNVKVMIVTAKADALKWNEDLKGCDKFVSKPFDNKALLEDIKSLL